MVLALAQVDRVGHGVASEMLHPSRVTNTVIGREKNPDMIAPK